MPLIVYPNTLLAGQTARASEVMANFQAVSDVVNGGIEAGNLADLSVATGKLQNGSVTDAKLATGAVTTNKLVDGSVTRAKLASSAVGGDELAAQAVGESHLANRAVTHTKLADAALIERHFSLLCVPEEAIQNHAVTTDKIAPGSVTTSKLADGSVTPNKLGSTLANLSAIQGLWAGRIRSTSAELPAGWSVSTDSSGRYVVTHNLNTDRLQVVATCVSTGEVATVSYLNDNIFRVAVSGGNGVVTFVAVQI